MTARLSDTHFDDVDIIFSVQLSHAYANFTLVINLTWGDAAMSVGANKWRLQYSARNHEWRSSSSVSRGVRFGA